MGSNPASDKTFFCCIYHFGACFSNSTFFSHSKFSYCVTAYGLLEKYIVAHLIGIGQAWVDQLDACSFVCVFVPVCSIRVTANSL